MGIVRRAIVLLESLEKSPRFDGLIIVTGGKRPCVSLLMAEHHHSFGLVMTPSPGTLDLTASEELVTKFSMKSLPKLQLPTKEFPRTIPPWEKKAKRSIFKKPRLLKKK